GIIMYSEGMAIPSAMPGIVAGRVHDALFMPPPLNLNKFIRPDFAIFRVSQLADGPIHRESCVAFFNGYGTEINVMRPGRPQWIEEEFAFLGKTTLILRDNSPCFLDMNWTPLLNTLVDSIWVNRWSDGNKVIFTVFSLVPEGYKGPLFETPVAAGFHAVSLWNHEEIKPDTINGKIFLPVKVAAFDKSFTCTRKEGNVDCIALLKQRLTVGTKHGMLDIQANGGTRVKVWAGEPSYAKIPALFPTGQSNINLYDHFRREEGKFVIQLFDNETLIDERIVDIPLATPRLISHIKSTERVKKCPEGMKLIPAGNFFYRVKRDSSSQEAVIPFPDYSKGSTLAINKFFMDICPVTNADYQIFIEKTGYRPRDTTHFLAHWSHGKPVKGTEKEPVVYVSPDDAQAYAGWAGKRLPSEMEWQYAAQGNKGWKYPWGNKMDSLKCNFRLNHPTPVDRFYFHCRTWLEMSGSLPAMCMTTVLIISPSSGAVVITIPPEASGM
ncbi:MAG: SUMF1/EgtB/PvdO family nonheme iron enzyme, partial [Bacteroidetes bacterium]|nr:SUMF1/EgtB/PvdO family nonheme iron enzyme [Bacteroidota bacterium]